MKHLLLIFLFAPLGCFGKNDSINDHHVIGIEAFGKAVLFGSIFYEYKINSRFRAGASLGFAEYNRRVRWQEADISYSNSFFASYRFHLRRKSPNPKKWTRFQFGATWLHTTDLFLEPTRIDKTRSEVFAFSSLGYEFESKKMIFRIDPYLLFADNPITDIMLPWLGLSVARKF